MSKILDYFKNIGAELLIPQNHFRDKVEAIKVLIFDWDGVFHSGQKDSQGGSTFSEIDSMGINMLRFGYYLKNNVLPKTFIITGEENITGQLFAEREHLDAIFFKAKNKLEILNFIEDNDNVNASEVAFFFDDILDLSLADKVGLRIMVANPAMPFLKNYCKTNCLADYTTAHGSSKNAIRECSELFLDAMNKNEEVIKKRIEFEGEFSQFMTLRNNIITKKIAKVN